MKVINSFVSDGLAILFLDDMPAGLDKVRIDGEEYDALIPDDRDNCIAIVSNKDFKDKEIEFF